MIPSIQVYEHQKLSLGGNFKERHQKALLKLNELHSFNYLEATANGVRFKSYVGIVQIDDLIIEILPKIDNQGGTVEMWRDVLLDMLDLTQNVKAHQSDQASVKRRNRNLLEVYLDLFLREIDSLQKRGLCKQYRLNTDNTLALKGKLEIAGHLRKNYVHKERFYTTHQVYDHDHLIHKVLRKAIGIVLSMTRQSYLAARAGRVHLSFPDVESAEVTNKSFDQIHLNRKTKQYSKALELARIIIENYSPSIKSGGSKMLALLFDMNSLWENYVYKILHDYQEEGGYILNKPVKRLFDVGRYRLEPDMFLEFNNGDKLVIDTKWKVPKNEKASIADLRQIFAYNRYWNASKGILLYPGTSKDSGWMKYMDSDLYDKKGDLKECFCRIQFLDLLKENKLNKTCGGLILNR